MSDFNNENNPQTPLSEPAPQENAAGDTFENTAGMPENEANETGKNTANASEINAFNGDIYNDEDSGESGYYVHKSNGYIPPEIKSGNDGDFNAEPNFNPYDRKNGVFKGGELPPQKSGNGLAITSMVLGIISLILCCCGHVITVILAVTGLACGIVALTKRSSGFALAGVITSAIGLIFGIVGIVISANSEGVMDWFDSWLEDEYLPEFPEDSQDSSFDHNHQAFLSDLLFFIRLNLGF